MTLPFTDILWELSAALFTVLFILILLIAAIDHWRQSRVTRHRRARAHRLARSRASFTVHRDSPHDRL